MKKIYVASSWRNGFQPAVVNILREQEGHEVYDFRNPSANIKGFAWSDIDPNWETWTTSEYKKALNHPRAIEGFGIDMRNMEWADTCVLVLPCGRSANLEAGWMKGQGKQVYLYQPIKQEPDLMYKMLDGIAGSINELVKLINKP